MPMLNAPEKKQNQYDQNDEPEAAARPVSPIPAIRPWWDCAN